MPQGGESRRRMSASEYIDLTSDSEVCAADPLAFPEGAVRLTYNRFAPMDRSQYLTFDEILGPVRHRVPYRFFYSLCSLTR